MPLRVDLSILNQKGTPAFYSDTFANRPAFGFAGRVFISTDTAAIYEDTGTSWTLISNVSSGAGTLEQVTTNGNTTTKGIVVTSGNVAIGTATASAPLDIHTTGTAAQFNGTGTNNAYVVFQNAGTSKWRIGNTYNAGANSLDIYNTTLATTALSFAGSNSNATFINNVSAISYDGTATDGNYFLRNEDVEFRNHAIADSIRLVGRSNNTQAYFYYGSTGNNYFGYNGSSFILSGSNFLVNTTTDAGNKFQVNGNGYISTNLGIGSSSVTNGTTYGGGGQTNPLKISGGNYPCLEINSTTDGGGSIQFTYGINLPNQVKGGIGFNSAGGAANEFNIFNVTNGIMTFGTNNTTRFTIKANGTLNIATIPTSSVGLSSGDIYSNAGILTRVP